MKPVHQTIFGLQGNCMTAAVATLLEQDIKDVPYFNGGEVHEFWNTLWNYFYSKGFVVFDIQRRKDEHWPWMTIRGSRYPYCLAECPSQSIEGCSHIVVAKINAHGEIVQVFDPNPNNKEINKEFFRIYVLFPVGKPHQIEKAGE